MTSTRLWQSALAAMSLSIAGATGPRALAQSAARTLDDTIPPGANYDKALFRLWTPAGVGHLEGTIILVPGSNGDGRSEVADSTWQAFATSHRLALVGCYLTDKPHAQSFIEEYVNVAAGTGPALLSALSTFAGRSGHPELASAPLLLWGMSAGGEFNYEFVNWKPERVIAFVVNKGGIYYTALASQGARSTPGLLFIGGNDLEFRTNTIVGLFAVNRRAGALWALAEEPGVAHVVGRSKDMAIIFFDDVLRLRLAAEGSGEQNPAPLKPVLETAGIIGDLKAHTFQPMAGARPPTVPTAWMPTDRVARAWQAMATGSPFER